jgi:putative pyruvate formate lyase activating enzyme
VGSHFGEEPPISATKGSGTVFLSGCSLKCVFCQNRQISHQGLGRPTDPEKLLWELQTLIQDHQVHNINFVTPDHFFPHIFQLIELLRAHGFNLPMVFNTSGYQCLDLLKQAREYADVFLPDYKYSDPALAEGLSRCKDYPQVALDAISEMVRQKGFLNVGHPGDGPAGKGVLVRHLILPGHVENSIAALTSLFLEFGRGLPISLMSQYHPVCRHPNPELNRPILKDEFDKVYNHALELGFETLFVQFPEKEPRVTDPVSPFLPDFRKIKPFGS